MCRDTWKVIRSLQLLIPHRMRPYSSAKGLCGLSYTFFTGTQLLGQFGETGPPQWSSCTGIPIVCPLLRLGEVLEFWIFWFFGEVKIFLISGGEGGFPMGGRGYIYLGKVSSFSVHFTKNSKNFACGTLIFNIHIVRFKIHARLQRRY